MITTQTPSKLQFPPDLTSKEFANNKYEYYKWMREEAPIFRGKFIAGESYVLTLTKVCQLSWDKR